MAATTTTRRAPMNLVVTQPADGQAVTVALGDTLTLVFTSCGGCGYHWEMTGQPDSVVFAFVGEQSTPPTTTPATTPAGSTTSSPTTSTTQPVTGSSVSHTFTFKAVGAHTTGFIAGYFAPGQNTPSRTVTLSLHVTR